MEQKRGAQGKTEFCLTWGGAKTGGGPGGGGGVLIGTLL